MGDGRKAEEKTLTKATRQHDSVKISAGVPIARNAQNWGAVEIEQCSKEFIHAKNYAFSPHSGVDVQ